MAGNTAFPGGITSDVVGNVTGNLTGDMTGNLTGDVTGDVTGAIQNAVDTSGTAAGTIAAASKVVVVGGGGSVGLTLAQPTAGTHDGMTITFVALDAETHTINPGTIGFNAGNDSVATFGGAIGDGFTVVAYDGEWYTTENINVTFA